jgi:hypothetical protein
MKRISQKEITLKFTTDSPEIQIKSTKPLRDMMHNSTGERSPYNKRKGENNFMQISD